MKENKEGFSTVTAWWLTDDRTKMREQLIKRLEQSIEQRTAELAEANAQLRREVEERRQAEEKLRHENALLHQLLELHKRHQQLAACEIHDGPAQQLAAALCRFRNSERLFGGNPHQSQQDFLQGMQLLEESLRDTRRLIDGLRPGPLDESGLLAAIEKLAAQNGPDSPQVELVDEAGLDGLAGPLEDAVFGIVREALNNACRHSRSPRVRVHLRRGGAHLCVEVEDWGIGFDPSRVGSGHFGLESIRQRARLFGGKATIQSAPGQGTRILAELPLDFDALTDPQTPSPPAPLPQTGEGSCVGTS